VRPWVTTWMHHKHLLVDGSKMSKSKGNFHTLKDLEDRYGKEITGAFRYLIASGHYRNSLDFSFTGLEAAERTLRNLRAARELLAEAAGAAPPSDYAEPFEARFVAAMNDDLNSPEALAALHELRRHARGALSHGELSAEDAASALALIDKADRVFGLTLQREAREVTAEQRALIAARAAARAGKDWAEADRLRDVLAAEGVLVKDTPAGQEISFS